jgi:acyl-CoA synthetase (AMP-forming)/AMP-acid ligase II
MIYLTSQLAWGFRNEFQTLGGVPLVRGDVVMLLSPNSIVWPVIMYGCIAAGIVVSPANPACTAYELLYQFENSRSKAFVVHPRSIPTVLRVFKLQNICNVEARRRIIIDDLSTQLVVPRGFVKLSELMNKGRMEQEEPFDDAKLVNETALLYYSSGTTGKPKGVEVCSVLFFEI